MLPINSALNPIIYTLAAPTELRRRIFKWCQHLFHHIECSLNTDSKHEHNTSSVVSHTSMTAATEARSSNGSAISLPMAVHSAHSNTRSCHHVRTFRLWENFVCENISTVNQSWRELILNNILSNSWYCLVLYLQMFLKITFYLNLCLHWHRNLYRHF